jgi:site-specific DNA-adenine methylase
MRNAVVMRVSRKKFFIHSYLGTDINTDVLVHFMKIIQVHIEDFCKKHARDEGIIMGFVRVY